MGFPFSPYLLRIGISIFVGWLGFRYLVNKKDRPPTPRYYQEDYYDYYYEEEEYCRYYEEEYHSQSSYNYDTCDESDSGEQCTICLQNILSSDSTQLSCGHELHTSCLTELKRQNSNANCPQCRADI